MDFSEPDKADEIKLNGMAWRTARGADSMTPALVRAASYRSHSKDKNLKVGWLSESV